MYKVSQEKKKHGIKGERKKLSASTTTHPKVKVLPAIRLHVFCQLPTCSNWRTTKIPVVTAVDRVCMQRSLQFVGLTVLSCFWAQQEVRQSPGAFRRKFCLRAWPFTPIWRGPKSMVFHKISIISPGFDWCRHDVTKWFWDHAHHISHSNRLTWSG